MHGSRSADDCFNRAQTGKAMKKIIFILVFLSLIFLAWGARKEGFFPYPSVPITIVIQGTSHMIGKGYPGGADGPPPSSKTFSQKLYGFNLPPMPCTDNVAPLGNGENVRDVTCWEHWDNVPFFGGGAPSSGDTIWVAYWRAPNDPAKPLGDTRYAINAAYASYGACWLAAKRQHDAEYATYLANFRAKSLANGYPILGPQIQCSAQSNPNAK
jgi:hypothetical protein